MAYLEDAMEVIFHQQQLELEVEKAMREILDAEVRDYAEYSKCMAFHPDFRKTRMSFSQWSDIKYNNLKHIRQWTRKRF